MKATIVTLSPKVDGAENVSFEEAFGEFSEARGRGRNRRQKRKLDRIAKRRERKKARQSMRAEQQESRQLRKDTRKSRRVLRKGMGEEPETEEQTTSQEQSQDTGSEQDSGSNQSQGSDYAPSMSQESDSAQDNQGNGEGEYQGEGGGYSADDEGQNESEGGDDAEVDNETGESDEESGFTGEVSGIDGAINISPEDAEWNEYFSSAEGKAKINPKVKELSRKIEQNKEMIGRLQKQYDKMVKNQNAKADKLNARILKRKSILAELESKLAGYSKFDGDDYSQARGGKRGVARRKAEVRQAKRMARQERKRIRKGTPVEENLKAEFSEQRIEVPAEEIADFSGRTGLIGLDNQEDADAPETRVVDLRFSNVEGEKSNKVRNIAIGIGVGVLAILIIRKLTKK